MERCANGKKGGESTKQVFYNAVFKGLDGDNLLLTLYGQESIYSVPQCNIQGDPEWDYVIRNDGTCYKYEQHFSTASL